MSFLQTTGIALEKGRDMDRIANRDFQEQQQTEGVEDERKLQALLGQLAIQFDQMEEARLAKGKKSTRPKLNEEPVGAINASSVKPDFTTGNTVSGAPNATQDPNAGAAAFLDNQSGVQGFADGGEVRKKKNFSGIFDASQWDGKLSTLPSMYKSTISEASGVDPDSPNFFQEADKTAKAMESVHANMQQNRAAAQQIRPQPQRKEIAPQPQQQLRQFKNGGMVKRYANGGQVTTGAIAQQGQPTQSQAPVYNNQPLYPGFADGGAIAVGAGEVDGPGTGTSDSIPARLSDGEYIIPQDVVAAKGIDFFDKLVEKFHTPVAEAEEGEI